MAAWPRRLSYACSSRTASSAAPGVAGPSAPIPPSKLMAKFGLVCAVVLAFALPASALKANSTIPITQKVTIDGVEVYGQSSGHASLNQCVSFDKSTVNDPNRPSITVCGSQTKVTVYLLNRCDNRHNSHTVEIGVRDSAYFVRFVFHAAFRFPFGCSGGTLKR